MQYWENHIEPGLLGAARSIQRTIQSHPRRVLGALALLLMTGAGLSFAVSSLESALVLPPTQVVVEAAPLATLAPQIEALAAQTMTLYRSEVSRANETGVHLLKRLGVVDFDAATFLRTDALARQYLGAQGGRKVSAQADANNNLQKMVVRWPSEDAQTFRRLTITRQDAGFKSTIEILPLVRSVRMASGTISSSFFASADAAKVPDSISAQLVEVFSGEVDFHRSLRKGDRFSLVYDMLEGDGEFMRAGRLLNAEFVNAGKVSQAIWFQSAQGAGNYYNSKGESLKKNFLASPMAFSRVTSGFAMRLHPIWNTWRAHLGVDYGAATGTPVRTVGDGVVEFAGTQNGLGRVILVRHNATQVTVYAHLSKQTVKTGQRVVQGQTIGLVGATGWATGPHLHFEFRVNGVHQDPLTAMRRSPVLPIEPNLRSAFENQAKKAKELLAQASLVQVATMND